MFFCYLVKIQWLNRSERSFSVSVLTRKETSETKKVAKIKIKIKTRATDAHDYVTRSCSVGLWSSVELNEQNINKSKR